MSFEQPQLSKMQPLVHPKLLPNYVFHAIAQKLDKKFEEKANGRVCFDRIDQFYTDFLFPACYFFCYWEKLLSHAWLVKNCI